MLLECKVQSNCMGVGKRIPEEVTFGLGFGARVGVCWATERKSHLDEPVFSKAQDVWGERPTGSLPVALAISGRERTFF